MAFEACMMSHVSEHFFNKFDIQKIDIYSLMFQTGYLTIKKRNEDDEYTLAFPNEEVRCAFESNLLEEYSNLQL